MEIKDSILAVVTTNKDKIIHSGVPVFYEDNKKDMERVALLISKVTMAMVHNLENECMIVVKH